MQQTAKKPTAYFQGIINLSTGPVAAFVCLGGESFRCNLPSLEERIANLERGGFDASQERAGLDMLRVELSKQSEKSDANAE